MNLALIQPTVPVPIMDEGCWTWLQCHPEFILSVLVVLMLIPAVVFIVAAVKGKKKTMYISLAVFVMVIVFVWRETYLLQGFIGALRNLF